MGPFGSLQAPTAPAPGPPPLPTQGQPLAVGDPALCRGCLQHSGAGYAPPRDPSIPDSREAPQDTSMGTTQDNLETR
jgi:hypothetical protein